MMLLILPTSVTYYSPPGFRLDIHQKVSWFEKKLGRQSIIYGLVVPTCISLIVGIIRLTCESCNEAEPPILKMLCIAAL
jgi:hypothetical protein